MPALSKLALPVWSITVPLFALGMLLGCADISLSWLTATGVSLALISAVFAAVFHAEVIAHRVGEPLGTLLLALAVTIIEVSLIVSLMLSGDANTTMLARDTVFATVMIICNGVVGLCLLVGAIRHRVVAFRVEGTSSALSVLAALTTLTLVLPEYTTSTQGPTYSEPQLAFAGLMSLLLYAVFIFVQTVRHRDYFQPLDAAKTPEEGQRPSSQTSLVALVLLLIALVCVVGLAKLLAPAIQSGVNAAGAPAAVVGIAIALLVLLPETGAALQAAARNRMQTSLNLALGSALATIGLTIPAVAIVSIWLDIPLVLGLPAKEIVLLSLTLLVSTITLADGRATVLQGAVHLVLFAAFLFLAIIP